MTIVNYLETNLVNS